MIFSRANKSSSLPDVNECSDRVLDQLPDDERRKLADKIFAEKPAIQDLTRKEFKVVLKALPLETDTEAQHKMKEEMDFGVKFLLMLLDREGPSHVINCAKTVNEITKSEQKLHGYDLDDRSALALSAARRRHFVTEYGPTMGTAWLAFGLPTTVLFGNRAIADGIDMALGESSTAGNAPCATAKDDDEKRHPTLSRLRDQSRQMDRDTCLAEDMVETGIGVGLSAEGVLHYKRKTDEHIDEIADAVSQLTKFYPELKNPPPEHFRHTERWIRTSPPDQGRQ